LEAWSGNAVAAIAGLNEAMAEVKKAALARDTPAVNAGCRDLELAVALARVIGPVPVADIDRLWGPGLDSLGTAAQACLTGDYGLTSTALDRGGDLMTQASEATLTAAQG
jgi:hypothetical protein